MTLPQEYLAPPAGVPSAIRTAQRCWAALLVLEGIGVLINAIALGGAGANFQPTMIVGPLLALFAFQAAKQLAPGNRGKRTTATVCGAINGALRLLGVALIVYIAPEAPGGWRLAVTLLLTVGAIVLDAVGIATMFRREVTAYLGASR